MASPRRVRRYLLDPRFQLKWTSYLVVVVLAVMVGLGFLIARLASRASDTAQIAVTQAEKAFKESKTNNILARGAVEMAGPENAGLAAAMNESLAEVDKKQSKNLDEVKALQESIGKDRKSMQMLLIGAGVVLLVILTLMGIVITHRIVGPVYKMKRLLRRVSTGRLAVDARLRKGDELEDLFETFLQMTYSLRAMQNAHIATLDATLHHAEESQAAPEVLEGMRALRAQLMLGMEKRHGGEGRAIHSEIAPAIEELCAAFERHDYNPTPVIDIGVLVANADGTVDEQERALLSDVFQTLLETNLTPELVDALIRASAEVIQAAGAEPRARLVGAILHDCDAAEPGLRVALAIAFSSEGLSADERSIIDKIADAADVSQEHLAELVKEVEKHSEKGDPVSTRMSLLPEHLRSQ